MSAAHSTRVSRRELLRQGLALSIAVSGSRPLLAGLVHADHAVPMPAGPAHAGPESLAAWLLVHADSSVTAYFGKTDLGQGVDTAIAQVVAEELDVAIGTVSVIMGDTALTQNQGGLSASTACSAGATPLRNAAAEARRLLIEAAAAHFSVTAAELEASEGQIFVRADPGQRLSYGDIVAGRPLRATLKWNGKEGNSLNVSGVAAPKNPQAYRLVGQPVARQDLPAKILGTAQFCHHIQLPGMLHGRMVRGPSANAVPLRVDPESIASIPHARCVRLGNLLAVVAPVEWDAVRAAKQLAVQWSTPEPSLLSMEELHAHILAAPAVASNGANAVYGKRVVPDIEPVERALGSAARILEAEYRFPFQSHARLAPSVALATVGPQGVLVYSDTQKPHAMRRGLAELLTLPEDRIRIVWKPGPGSYGRSDADEAAFEAALLSREVGAPVRVQWMRDEGMAWDPKAPAAVISARAGLDALGNISAWHFRAKGFSGWEVASSAAKAGDTLAGMQLGFHRSDNHNFAVPEQSYAFPNAVRYWETIAAIQDVASPLRCSNMRAPEEPQVQFASECFVDEVAIATGEDPLALRQRYLRNPRELGVLDAVARASGWSGRAGPGSRGQGSLLVGRGIAAGPMFGTFVAVVCEVEVERDTGRVWPRRLVVAHDCGLVINPLGLRRTIEGNVIQGLSRTLCEEVRFDRAHVRSVDWNSYPILDVGDVPESVEIVIIDPRDQPSSGAGEGTLVFVGPAVGNAVFDATGVRFRRLPLTAERILAGLQNTSQPSS